MNQSDRNFSDAASRYDRQMPDDDQESEGDCPKCKNGTTNFWFHHDEDGPSAGPMPCDDCKRREEEGDESDVLDQAMDAVKPITAHVDHDHSWVEAELRELGVPPRPSQLMEVNFAANIITMIDMRNHSNFDATKCLDNVRAQAEKMILMIKAHNDGKDFSSTAIMKAHAAGAGHIPFTGGTR